LSKQRAPSAQGGAASVFIKDDRIERMNPLSCPEPPSKRRRGRCEGCPWRPTPRNSPPALMKRERKERGQSVPLPLRATLLKLLRLPSFRSLRGAIIRAFSAPMVCRQDKGSEYWPINTGAYPPKTTRDRLTKKRIMPLFSNRS